MTLTLFSKSHQPFEMTNSDTHCVPVAYLWNRMMDSDQTPYSVSLCYNKELIRFGDLDLISRLLTYKD